MLSRIQPLDRFPRGAFPSSKTLAILPIFKKMLFSPFPQKEMPIISSSHVKSPQNRGSTHTPRILLPAQPPLQVLQAGFCCIHSLKVIYVKVTDNLTALHPIFSSQSVSGNRLPLFVTGLQDNTEFGVSWCWVWAYRLFCLTPAAISISSVISLSVTWPLNCSRFCATILQHLSGFQSPSDLINSHTSESHLYTTDSLFISLPNPDSHITNSI